MLVQLDANNMKLFTGVTSVEALDRFRASIVDGIPVMLGIGACDEDGLITGCLLCEITDDTTAEINWLYVREQNRRLGYATEMLEALCESMKVIGMTRLVATITETSNVPDTSLRDFLGACGFDTYLMTDDLYLLGIADLRDALPRGCSKGMDVVSIKQIPGNKIYSFVQKYTDDKSPVLPLIKSESMEVFSDCSCACMDGSEIAALALFVERDDKNGISAVLFDYDTPEQALALLDIASKDALLSYKRTGVMSITTLDGMGTKIMDIVKCQAERTSLYGAGISLS